MVSSNNSLSNIYLHLQKGLDLSDYVCYNASPVGYKSQLQLCLATIHHLTLHVILLTFKTCPHFYL